LATKIQVRRDTASQWSSNNPTLDSGEIGFVTDENKIKLGDGSTAWNSLEYVKADAIVDSVELGTDTTGNYVETLVAGSGVSLSGEGSESASVTITNEGVVSLAGTASEVEVSASSGSVIIGLPDSVNISTDLTVGGNLTVNGTTTTVNSTTVTVDDKNIELGSTGSPTDTSADGGGITLKGTTDKTFNWIDSTDSWTSSENIDLATGKVLKINGTEVLSNSNYTGNAATATSLETARTISLGGDLSGSASFDGTGDVTVSATIEADSVELGADTTGDYVADVSATGNGLSVTGTGEGASVVIENTGVTSLTGTASEVEVSASAGSITISLPSTINADTSGNAATATALASAQSISLTGDVSGSASFDGSSGVSISATVADDSHDHTDKAPINSPTFTGTVTVPGLTSTGTIVGTQATTSLSTLRIPHGTAPTSPTDGDMWSTTSGLFIQVNGSTVGPLGTGGGGGGSSATLHTMFAIGA